MQSIRYELLNVKTLPICIRQIQLLNAAVLPVRYSDKFYKGFVGNSSCIVVAAWHDKKLVGAGMSIKAASRMMRSEVEKVFGGNDDWTIDTLAVLAAHRGLGIGTSIMKTLITQIQNDHSSATRIHIHVQLNEDHALLTKFYERFGFKTTLKITGYYGTATWPDALLLTCDLRTVEEASTTGE